MKKKNKLKIYKKPYEKTKCWLNDATDSFIPFGIRSKTDSKNKGKMKKKKKQIYYILSEKYREAFVITKNKYINIKKKSQQLIIAIFIFEKLE